MSTIKSIHGLEILDSRGNPTVEVVIRLDTGVECRASVPSGASKGTYEAFELRDGTARYLGLGVQKAVNHVNTVINSLLKGKNIVNQEEIDYLLIDLDGSTNKKNIGGNSILAVSLAIAKAAATVNKNALFKNLISSDKYLMPVPLMNVINGGVHADNLLDFQEFMIVPHGANTFTEALRYGAEIFHCLKKILRLKGYRTSVGDEGGFAPDLPTTEAAIELILQAIETVGLRIKDEVSLALDVAASEFYSGNRYQLQGEKKDFTSEEFIEFLSKLCKQYPILSIEDGMSENDWDGWEKLTSTLGNNCQLVGDDIFVTNPQFLKKGIARLIANAILIKPNQIGTLTETLETIKIAKNSGYSVVISHRSGETEETFIADLAVSVSSGQIKTGSLSRTDRVAKYNQLLRIEDEYSQSVYFDGKKVFEKYLN